MSDLSVTIDSLPDSDSFLPRHHTVQLIAILAGCFPSTVTNKNTDLSASAQQFVADCKALKLFTPLTNSIFWREDYEPILAKINPTGLDELDRYNRSALTIALSNEDFALANKLIKMGATVFLEDKLVLEIALTSMLQLDNSIIAKIMDATTEGADKVWMQNYLDYLNSYVLGNPTKKNMQLHEVLDPTVRHFGQILDTLVYFNGTPSHYGFLSPSLDILTNHLHLYLKEVQDPLANPLFAAISKAYDYSYNACKFHGNLPTNTNAAADLAAQITANLKINSKEATMVFGGWAGNSVAIAFVNNVLIISNLGTGGDPQQGTKIYAINNPAAITTEAINTFICGLGKASAAADILALIGNMVDPKPLCVISQLLSPIDNCIFVNPRAIIQGLLLVLSTGKSNDKITADNLRPQLPKVAEQYSVYLESLYKNSTNDLARFMRNHELLKKKRIECCSLALEYINQHYQNNQDMTRCIELKNALEFVGLGDYYVNNINPAAKQKIQEQVIREQELTAIKVIQQEAEILAKQG